MKKIILIIFLVSIATTSSASQLISVSGGLITIAADNTSLSSLLKEIENTSGITFITDDSLKDEMISVKLKENKIENVLNRLLKKYNKAFEYDNFGNIKLVYIKPSSSPKKWSELKSTDHRIPNANNNFPENNEPISPFSIAHIEKKPSEMSDGETSSVSSKPNEIIEENPQPMD